MNEKRVLAWANLVSGLGIISLFMGTVGAIILGIQKGECADGGMYSCYEYEYPYIAVAIGAGAANLLISSTLVLLASYIEWSVTSKGQQKSDSGK